jgi:hypothetical protein
MADMEMLLLIVAAVGGYFLYKKVKATKAQAQITVAPEIWATDFVVYYTARLFQDASPGKIPDGVLGLLDDELSRTEQGGLLAAMQEYTAYSRKARCSSEDVPAVHTRARQFLRAELDAVSSPDVLRRFIRRMHTVDTGQAMTDTELDAQFNEIRADIKADEDKARALRAMLLRDSIEESFERRHGKSISTYLQDMRAAQG